MTALGEPAAPSPSLLRAWRGRRRLPAPSARVTNLTLLAVLIAAFGTGAGATATGSERGRWIVIAHGVAGMAVILLVPWKGRVVRAGLRRARRTRWLSLLLAALVVTTVLLGLGYSSGVLRSVGGTDGMWLHVAVALALVPLILWHLVARWARPRKTDLSRRVFMRTGALGLASAGLYLTSAGVVTVAGLPGTRRRFTGSYERGSFDPTAMPNTIWLDDTPPRVDAGMWRLTVVDRAGSYDVTLAELRDRVTTIRATLDCTSGWFAHQDWTGVAVPDLIREVGHARSLLVHSVTGYWIRLPVHDLDTLLLATAVGGEPLTRGHGYPLRLVAPNRRGFWWVKWVDRIELQDTPWWWQPPFPVT